jgi:N-acetylmuramoyl-L-alanine amidase CwlA
MNPVIHEKLIPAGHPNRPGTKLEKVLALVVHYTANDKLSATDEANARYMGRLWEQGPYIKWNSARKIWELTTGFIEFASIGRGRGRYGIGFNYGSTQRIADADSVTSVIPFGEVAWGCGDRQLPWDPVYKGQQPLANSLFGNRQNYLTISWEICNNDIYPNTRDDWEAACHNCRLDMAAYMKDHNLTPVFFGQKPDSAKQQVLILRHYDLTGKNCPAPFVQEPKAWSNFCTELMKLL